MPKQLILFFIMLFALGINAQDKYRAIHWTVKDGLSEDIANVLIKDTKGFIWVGAGAGELCRFDGFLFKKYAPDLQTPGAIHFNKITSFVEDSLKNIWIGSSNGLARYDMRADTFSNFVAPADSVNSDRSIIPFWSTNNEVFCVEGRLNVVTYDIRLLERKPLLTLKKAERIHIDYAIVDTITNSLWMLNNSVPGKEGLVQISLSDHTRQFYSWPCYRNLPNHDHSCEAMQLDRKRNSIWLNSRDGLLEFSLNDKQFHLINAFKEFIKLKDYDRWVGMDIDRQGRIWLATQPNGILIYDPKTGAVKPLFSDLELQKTTSHANFQIYCDPDGIGWSTYWLDRGIHELLPYNPAVTRFAAKPGMQDSLSNGFIHTIVPAADSKIWIGTNDGLNIFDPVTNKFEVLHEKDLPGISGIAIVPLHIDTVNQKAWLNAGSTDPLKFYEMDMYEMDLKTKKCRPVIFRDGSKQLDSFVIIPIEIKPYKNGFLAVDDNHGVFEIKAGSPFADLVIPFDKQQAISSVMLGEERFLFLENWVGVPHFTYENRNGKWIKIPHPFDSVSISSMYYDKKNQTYWRSSRYELVQYDNKFREIKTYKEDDGYNNYLFNLLTDNSGNLWFANNVEQVGRLNITSGIFTFLSEADGYTTKDFDWSVPAAKDARGNLYFGTGGGKGSKGLDHIHPERYSSPVTSSVYLRTLSVNQKPFPLSIGVNNLEKLSLRYNQNTISIETGIVDFYSKGKGRIRYKLIEGDQEGVWQYDDAYSTIRYEKLPPGKYELLLQASNTGNEFNSPEKKLVIDISPPFWQTWWFRITAAVALLLSFYGIYRWRTATLRRQKRILEQTVKERTAEVVEEKAEVEKQKAKSDELLLNILPLEVAEELKEKGYTTAKSFDEVTILFSDIKGFTHVAEKLTAQELVKEIDTYFSAFDNIMQQYGLEKIKTIGDAYIAAGGLPEHNAATVQNVVEAAIAMQRAVEELKRKRVDNNLPYFELRIGIHTGPVVAGVVGIKKFQYDIWGDTVNLAARMEQSGVPGKINISQYTYEKVKERFHCEHRGKIDAKNKGAIDMYFVIS